MLYLPCHMEMSTAARFSFCGIPIVVTTRGRTQYTREVFVISVFLSFGPDVVHHPVHLESGSVSIISFVYLVKKNYRFHTVS